MINSKVIHEDIVDPDNTVKEIKYPDMNGLKTGVMQKWDSAFTHSLRKHVNISQFNDTFIIHKQ